MSNTRIVVVKLKEILITAALVLTGIVAALLILLFVSADDDTPSASDAATTSALYHPGVYTSSMVLNDTTIHLELVCDHNHIHSVRLINLDEAVETMYPLLSPALSELELQLAKDISPDELVLSESSKYTQTLLIDIIELTLNKARVRN